MRFRAIFLGTTFLASVAFGELSEPTAKLTIARLRYSGGGDWYNDPDVIPNLLAYIREHTNILTAEDEARVGIMDPELFSYPILYMTGHGNINFSEEEARRLREYLVHVGFLYADDYYGMNKAFRRRMKRIITDEELVELGFISNRREERLLKTSAFRRRAALALFRGIRNFKEQQERAIALQGGR
ncbi:MAG: hypothetical protein DRQ14_09870 [Candidatus Latescibacterota bacterium]|nr:MAG: hypothetical protein DRQ14_09870 [Candidatus Latescibacterota bacterium]